MQLPNELKHGACIEGWCASASSDPTHREGLTAAYYSCRAARCFWLQSLDKSERDVAVKELDLVDGSAWSFVLLSRKPEQLERRGRPHDWKPTPTTAEHAWPSDAAMDVRAVVFG